MKMSEDDRELEALFKAARDDMPEMPAGLEARLLADAQAALPVRRDAEPGWRRWFDDLLMGWYGLGGLAAASAAGIWLGFAPPAALPDAGAYLFGGNDTSVDLFAGEDMAMILAEEG